MSNKWMEPDERWAIFGQNTREQFEKTYVIEGRFHSQVPEDIKLAYKTVEFLMAHSYYHWPMYDMAFHKMLLIFEMAVKLKALQKGISIVDRTKKRPEKDLGNLIKEIKPFNIHPERIDWALDHFRKLRNNASHPESNSYVGGIVLFQVYYLHNILNELFIEETYNSTRQDELTEITESMDSTCCVLASENKRNLIYSMKLIDTSKLGSRELFFISLERVVNEPDKFFGNNVQSPLILVVEYWTYNEEEAQLELKLIDGSEVQISKSEHPKDLEKYSAHGLALEATESFLKRVYLNHLESESCRQMEKLRYGYLWNTSF